MQYLEWWADQEGVPGYNDLYTLLEDAVEKLGAGATRSGGEREVPLHLWSKPEFQTWLSLQKAQGNRLDGAQVVWTFRVGKNKETTFLWALHVDVWVASEKRSKTNEVVLFRPDISSIVVYCRPPDRAGWDWLLDTEIVLVEEFRSPVANNLGMVREVPGGSSTKPGIDPGTLAAKELEEETGLAISEDRFKFVGWRQVASTLSAHRAHVYAVELTPEEMLALRWDDQTHGNHDETEYTFTRVLTVVDLLGDQSMDWANLGMLLQALLTAPDNL
jgi:8-oxo-dGTP pyrophosphatase MutT (NUDIX family)